MKTSTLAWTLLALAAAGAAGYRFLGPGKPGTGASGAESAQVAASGATGPRAAQTVSVFAAQQRDVPVTVESAGTVVALDSVDVRAQVTGTVAEVLVKEGQFVRRGQPLFKLDDRADRANLERARAQLLRDQATLADLERQWKRAQDLRAQNFIAQSAADTVQANLEAQRAAVAATQAALRAAEVSLSYTTIVAPLTGRTGVVNVNRGSLVQPTATSAALVGINQIDPIGVAFTVPETQLSALLRSSAQASRGGSAASGAAGNGGGKSSGGAQSAARPASAAASAAGGTGAAVSIVIPGAERGRNAPPAEPLVGRVVFIDNAVDASTGTIRVKAQLPNANQGLWPGQYVTARMTMRTLAGAVVIPQAALIIRGAERSVYVVKPDGTAEMRPVQTRVPQGEFVVVEGVQAGEKIVVEGKQNLRPGGLVRETPYVPGAARRGPSPGASGAASGAASGNAALPSASSAPAVGNAVAASQPGAAK